jgi:hypothetical protein
LIHLDRQSSPSEFASYGPRVVPFYNYLQAALVLFEDEVLPAAGVLALAAELVNVHHFDARALERSSSDLARRGQLRGARHDELEAALSDRLALRKRAGASELGRWLDGLRRLRSAGARGVENEPVDYLALAERHNPRRHPASR